jgi:tetratricopeptide (TPR) repeat protein
MVAAKQFDSLAVYWNRARRPDLGAYYAEQSARAGNSAEAWLKAGNRYYYSIQFIEDKSETPLLYQCAMRCFSKVLALDPKNSDAKIMLASCFVEGSPNPMDGISLLREVERIDSNNVKLQLAFAFFSVKSGQLDKAVARFNKAIKADSTYIEAYLHLADAYEQMGETGKTIEALQAYAARTPDITSRLEIEKYITQLKSNINK